MNPLVAEFARHFGRPLFEIAVDAPAGVMEQEAAFLAALSTAAAFTVNGQVLEMRTADDAMALRFEVAIDSVVATAAASSDDPDPVAPDAARLGVGHALAPLPRRACSVRRVW